MREIKDNQIVPVEVYRVLDSYGNDHDYPTADYNILENKRWLEVWTKTIGAGGKVASFYEPTGYWKALT